MKIAVLALQGAFMEHERMLEQLGIESIEIRQPKDLEQSFDGLILPGGESTVMGKLLQELHLFTPLQQLIQDQLPVFGTCAGLILLAHKISNDYHGYFRTLPVTVRRNAYGRQLGSFRTVENFADVGNIPMEFIRAPYIEAVEDKVEILAQVDRNVVGVRYDNQLGVAFHPEVTNCTKVHEYFINMCKVHALACQQI